MYKNVENFKNYKRTTKKNKAWQCRFLLKCFIKETKNLFFFFFIKIAFLETKNINRNNKQKRKKTINNKIEEIYKKKNYVLEIKERRVIWVLGEFCFSLITNNNTK